MGRLMSFLGGAARSLQGSIEQDRLEQKRIEDEQRQHTQQVSWAKAANAIRIAQEQASKPPDQRASGMPFSAGPGGFQQATEVATPVKFDNDGNVTEAAGWAPGPSVSVPAPINKFKESKRVSGNDLVTYRVYEDGSEEEVARGPRASAGRGGGSGGSGAKDRFELRNIGGRVMRVNITTGEKEDMGPSAGEGSSGSGGMTEKGWREGMDQTLSSIQGADAGKLKSMIRQYGGMDDPVIQSMVKRNEAGEVDGDALREAAYVTAEKYWNERKPGNKAATEQPKNEGKVSFSEADAQVAAKRPDLTPEQRKQYLASKGIRP